MVGMAWSLTAEDQLFGTRTWGVKPSDIKETRSVPIH